MNITSNYNFDCTLCGDCCSGDMEISLLPYDLYKMARFLSFKNTKELYTKGYIKIEEGQNGLLFPKLKFKTVPYPFCPFLVNDLEEDGTLRGYCSLHPYSKPLVCSLAPAGRVYDFEKKMAEYRFTPPTPDCPGVNSCKENSLKTLEIELQEQFTWEENFYKKLFKGFIPTKDFYFFSVEEEFTEISRFF